MSKTHVSLSRLTRSSLARLRGTYRAHLFLSGTPGLPQQPERSAVKKGIEGDVYRIHPLRGFILRTSSFRSLSANGLRDKIPGDLTPQTLLDCVRPDGASDTSWRAYNCAWSARGRSAQARVGAAEDVTPGGC